jgi:hypothetical protein
MWKLCTAKLATRRNGDSTQKPGKKIVTASEIGVVL